jgi:hypothetical protein
VPGHYETESDTGKSIHYSPMAVKRVEASLFPVMEF